MKGGSRKYEDKKRDKRVRDGHPSWGGSHERGEVSKQQKTLSLVGLWEFWSLRGQHKQENKKKKKKNKSMHITTTPSGEVAQTLPFTTSEWGLDRVAWPECF